MLSGRRQPANAVFAPQSYFQPSPAMALASSEPSASRHERTRARRAAYQQASRVRERRLQGGAAGAGRCAVRSREPVGRQWRHRRQARGEFSADAMFTPAPVPGRSMPELGCLRRCRGRQVQVKNVITQCRASERGSELLLLPSKQR